jgi:hypothetical protein
MHARQARTIMFKVEGLTGIAPNLYCLKYANAYLHTYMHTGVCV